MPSEQDRSLFSNPGSSTVEQLRNQHTDASFASLQNTNRELRAVLNQTGTCIFTKDIAGRYTYVNQMVQDLLGASYDDIVGQDDSHFFNLELANELRLNDRLVMDFGETIEREETNIVKSTGDIRIYWAVKKPLFNDQGQIIGMCGISTDITERKTMEIALRNSSELLASIIDSTPSSIFAYDQQHRFTLLNDALTRFLGIPKEDVLGKTPHDVFPNDIADKLLAINSQILAKGEPISTEEIMVSKCMSEPQIMMTSRFPLRDVNGVIIGIGGVATNITERKTTEEQIKQLAFYDPLTQLPNRRLLQERLKHGISVERRDGKQQALLMLDLDRFKAVNDSLGHLAGDELLQQVAARLTARMREVDMVVRLGGDEFVVLLDNIAHQEDAARVAQDIIADLTKPFCLTQADNVYIGASIGICLYPQHGDSPDALMDHADTALYHAKDLGRGCFVYFSEDLTIAARKRMAMETRLHRAIEQQELCFFYQPKVDIASGRIVGAEALLRWQDPVEGLIQPSQFIPIAEASSLAVKIGIWVLREICRQGRLWLDEGLPPLTLAVNVSPHQFRRGDICALVTTVLNHTGFPPELLELEITESGLMENQDNALAILHNLRAQGVRLTIDDFGTGYSSLGSLKNFPLDILKIDKSFIDNIPFHQSSMEIAATIISMGHILGFKVLAEGVETSEQLAFLQEKGCDMYQGYIKSKPVSAEEFAELLRGQQRIEI